MTTLTTAADKAVENGGSMLDRWAKLLFIRFMNHIEQGQLKVCDGDEEMVFGAGGELSAHVTVLDQRFYSKMILGGSVGAGEAYIAHYWDTNDLVAVVRVFARNLPMLDRLEKRFGWLFQPYRLLQHRRNRNNKSGARRNIISHYDLGNDLYEVFLDSRMMYSSAIYPDESSNLEEAAVHKLTKVQADIYGIADRGVLAEGMWADLVVFDPATVDPGPVRRVRDFPADTERLTADQPQGIHHVVVNGSPIVRDGLPVEGDPRPGRLVPSVPRPVV